MSVNNINGGLVEHTSYSGAVFNKETCNNKFYKFIYPQYYEKYKLGLNIGAESSELNWISKGIYFCEESKCYQYRANPNNNNSGKFALIEIPNDARVYFENKIYTIEKFKSDKIIVKEFFTLADLPDDFWMKMACEQEDLLLHIKNVTPEICEYIVQRNGNALKYIVEQTENICKLAVQQNGIALRYVQNKTHDICSLAIKQNVTAIQYLNRLADDVNIDKLYILACQTDGYYALYNMIKTEKTEKLCKLAVQQNGMAIQFVDKKYVTNELCILAVKQNGMALQYIENQTHEICDLAIKQNVMALQFVSKLTDGINMEELYKLACRINGVDALTCIKHINGLQTVELCTLAVEQNYKAFYYVNSEYRTEYICKIAVKNDAKALEYVKNQTQDICLMAVQKNGAVLEFVKKEYKTTEICTAAIKQNYKALKYIENQTNELYILAVKQYWRALKYVKNQTTELCILAILQNENALQYVQNQTEYLCKLAVKKNHKMLQYVNEQFLTDEIYEIATHNIEAELKTLNQACNSLRETIQRECESEHVEKLINSPSNLIEEDRLEKKRIWNATPYKIKCDNIIFKYISDICLANNIGKDIEIYAQKLYKQTSDVRYTTGKQTGKPIFLRGMTKLSVVAGCLFVACYIHSDDPIIIEEIALFFDISTKNAMRGVRVLFNILKDDDIIKDIDANSVIDYMRY